ncbi:MAG: nucleotidyltransferase family protein [Anaerolineaceae bacterium]|nr:nucleotidyltransferase family protein [Anaerolineaceae bacterium]
MKKDKLGIKSKEKIKAGKITGIILAAGASRRLGVPKQTLLWKGETLIRHVAKLALESGLDPLIVVTGYKSKEVEEKIRDLPVIIAYNPKWEEGQSTSIRRGLEEVASDTDACLFLMSDQPQIPVALIKKIMDRFKKCNSMIIVPRVGESRGNPVLLSHSVFPDLYTLKGNEGGRIIFNRYPMDFVDWNDDSILIDVDTEDSYERLLELH